MKDTQPQMLVYVAGPYRARCEWDLVRNIRTAESVALMVWQAGHAAICPHLNTAHFGGAMGLPDEVWLKGDLTMLRRCDAVVLCPGWQRSAGTVAEVAEAKALGIPVVESVEGLRGLGVGKAGGDARPTDRCTYVKTGVKV